MINPKESRLRVLLVEDSILDAAIFQKQILKERGETVWILHVKTLKAATLILRKRSFDLVVLDLGLPDSDGLGTISSLRKQCANIPIVVLTGSEDEMMQRRALELGADDYILKNSMSPYQFWLNLTSTFSRFHRQRIEAHQQDVELREGQRHLPPRAVFEDRTQCMVSRSLRERLTSAVVIAEIVNPQIEDLELPSLTRLLNQHFRSSDSICELEQNRFAFVFSDIKEVENAEAIGSKIEKALMGITGTENCFIGISIFPLDGRSATDLISNAENALKAAKDQNDTLRFYSPLINEHLTEVRRITHTIEDAFAQHKIIPLASPILDLSSRDIYGFKILSSIQQSENGPLLTGARANLGSKIFKEIFEDITSEINTWKNSGWRSTVFSFNLFEADIYDTSTFENICSCVERGLIAPDNLCFDIPEKYLIAKSNIVLERLNTLRNLDVHLALDHFGDSVTSIATLRKFPMDIVKINPILIERLHRSGEDFKMVKAIIDSAHAFDKKVVANGVMTQEQLNLLSALHCDFVQGPFVGENIPLKEIRDYFKTKYG